MKLINEKEIAFNTSKVFIEKIDFLINSISKKNNDDNIIHWFQQSPLHWLLILFVLKSYFKNIELSKNELLEEINEHIILESKKTMTTEYKYIEDAIRKGYLVQKISTIDSRKKIISPSQETKLSMSLWMNNFFP